LRRRHDDFERAGARLVFVGPGTPAMARAFRDEQPGDGVVLSDVDRNSYRAAGMRRSIWALLHWRMVWNLLRALRGGFRQTKVQGDPWQQGGVLVFDAAGGLVHQQVDRVGGDELDADAVVAASRRENG